MHRTVLFITLLLVAVSAFSGSWEAAPASASATFEDAPVSGYVPLDNGIGLEALLTADQGWYWLRTSPAPNAADTHWLLTPPELAWTAWLNGVKIDSSGSPPPFWSPSLPMPRVYRLPTDGSTGPLLLKVYVRKGYGHLPQEVVTGTLSSLRMPRFIAVLESIGIPAASVVFGILLGIGGLAAWISRRTAWDRSLALFGLFTALASIDTVLAVLPDVSTYISWNLPGMVAASALPFSVSFWRRSVSSAGGRSNLAISFIDIALVLVTACWMVLPLTGFDTHPAVPAFVRSYDPLPFFVIWSAVITLVFWIIHTAVGRPGRIGSLLVMLAGFGAVVASWFIGAGVSDLPAVFVAHGLPAALVVSLPVMMARRSGAPSQPLERVSEIPDTAGDTPKDDSADEISELEEFEDLDEVEETFDAPVSDSSGSGALSDGPSAPPVPPMTESSRLARSIRAVLYPDYLPWDARWDAASARQGSVYPATGFHDVYVEPNGRFSGFSFMDAGSDRLEALVYAHLAKSEIAAYFPSGASLPRIARFVHRKSLSAAEAAGRTMAGVLGRFTDTGISFLPLALPPLLLRKADGRVIALSAPEGKGMNPPLGAADFGVEGLRTLTVSMDSGDVLMAYTPTIPRFRSPAGRSWGIAGLAQSLKNADPKRSDRIVASIIGDLKDFLGRDAVDGPLQILVLQKR